MGAERPGSARGRGRAPSGPGGAARPGTAPAGGLTVPRGPRLGHQVRGPAAPFGLPAPSPPPLPHLRRPSHPSRARLFRSRFGPGALLPPLVSASRMRGRM